MKVFLFLFITYSLGAQPKVFYLDDLVLPPESGKTKGYIVRANGDTLRGYLRNHLTLGQKLAPEQITVGNLLINFQRFPIEKIAFWPNSEEEKILFYPQQLKAFAFENSSPQLPIDLTAPPNAGGFIEKEELQKQLSLLTLLNRAIDAQAHQQRLHDGLIHYETLTHPATQQVPFFSQRLAEGNIDLYFWPQQKEYFIKRHLAEGHLVTSPAIVQYDQGGRFLQQTFGHCPEVQQQLSTQPELQRQENFIRLVGLTNLYCDATRPLPKTITESYVVNLQGDTLLGEINWLLFRQKIQFTDKQGDTRKLAPNQILAFARVTAYGTATIYESQALPGKPDKKMFCQVICDGVIKLMQNPAASVSTSTNSRGETTTRLGSYLLQKQGKEVTLAKKATFESLLKAYFSDCELLLKELEMDADLKSFHKIEDLVKKYNALCAFSK
jgi:hypothetical protein